MFRDLLLISPLENMLPKFENVVWFIFYVVTALKIGLAARNNHGKKRKRTKGRAARMQEWSKRKVNTTTLSTNMRSSLRMEHIYINDVDIFPKDI